MLIRKRIKDKTLVHLLLILLIAALLRVPYLVVPEKLFKAKQAEENKV